MNVTPFHVAPEDLAGLDRKTMTALQPLLEALNVTLGQLVAAVGAPSAFDTFVTQFASEATGSAYVDFTPRSIHAKPFSIVVDQIRRADDAAMSSVYSMSWAHTSTGVRCLFVGLDASARFALTVTIK